MTSSAIDAVVIGSGFGGAIAANRLALAGMRVLVLERGPWRDTLPVRSMGIAQRARLPQGRKFLTHFLHSVHGQRFGVRLNRSGLFELGMFPGMYTLGTSGVGGGSIAWGGILEPPRNGLLWHDRHPALRAADIERHYDRVVVDMGGVRVSREQPLPQSVWDHFPSGPDVRCQPAAEQPRVAMLMPPGAAQTGQVLTTDTGIQRRYCGFDGDGFLGSEGGTKASVDFVYLAPVLGKGACVRDLCEVHAIRRTGPTPHSGYEVEFRDLARGTRETVVAPRVVMAAGTLNTMRLMFSSSAAGGLAAMPALGRGFFGNGDVIAAWVKHVGSYSSFLASPLLGALSIAGHERVPIEVGSLSGFDTLPLPGVLKRYLARVLLLFAMGPDSGNATVRLVNGHLRTDYDFRREPIYDELHGALRVVQQQSGMPVRPLWKPLTPHAGGGARVSSTTQTGVIDHRGEVHGNPGLFVADAAALPAPVGGPPALSIAAWAHHVAEGIAASS